MKYKDIKGFEGLYQISNIGEVYSLINNIHLKQVKVGGYCKANLYKDGEHRMYSIHRLVAEAFLPNPNNLPEVNHKDENKTNNFVFINPDGSVNPEKSNLEWCTHEYNINYGTRNDRIRKAISGDNHYLSGKHHTQEQKEKISITLKGRPSPNKGKKVSENTKIRLSSSHKKKVKQYSKDGVFIKEWDGAVDAARELGIDASSITKCCKNNKQKTCGNYVWKY